jgi:hypothetical protein
MGLGPKPSPRTEPPEIVPGGPDAPGYEPTGVVRDIRASNPQPGGEPGPDGPRNDTADGMGVSSERVGHTGPGQHATDGIKDTSVDRDGDTDVPPEQRPGRAETNPAEVGPKAERPSLDPRSD